MTTANKLKLAFVFVLIAVGVHAYLAVHYYDLHFGISGESVCNINSKFNCDTTTASEYSAVMGIPVALLGATANGVLGLLLLIWIFGWSNDVQRLSRYTVLLTGFIAAISVVMGSISTLFIGSYCLFCMSEYALSFVIFGLVYSSREREGAATSRYVLDLLGSARMYLLFPLAIPLVAFLFHRAILDHYGANELPAVVRSAVGDWQASPQLTITEQPLFSEGGTNPKMVIAEFADFRCPHCRHAATPIAAYVNSHPDVQLRYYAFPLDGICNDVIPGGDGISCLLAKAVYCSEQVAHKGSALHDAIYSNQEDFQMNPSLSYAKDRVTSLLGNLGVQPEGLWTCVDNPDTDKAVRADAKAGASIGVHATPSFFVNGRQLMRGQLIPVLDAVHSTIK